MPDYLKMSEKFASEDLSDIGVHAHEFAHLLGLWDLYEYPGSIGTWGLMGYGCYGGNGSSGERPVQILGLEKEMLGWVSPTVVVEGSGSLSIPASATAGAVKAPGANGTTLSEADACSHNLCTGDIA